MTRRVVVVGSGIAGLVAALHAHAAGADVRILTKAAADEANTRYAQGGIAAVLDASGAVPGSSAPGDSAPGDSVAAHASDTLAAGAGIGDPAAIRLLVGDARARIEELIAAGVAFDRDADGALHRGREAAHARPRILHAGGDATGAAIEAALVAEVRRRGIPVRERTMLLDLVAADGRVTGVRVITDGSPQDDEPIGPRGPELSPAHDAPGRGAERADDRSSGPRVQELRADAVILATGGAGQLYAHTTNPAIATGDGIAAAIRAGATVADLEFVQFHPTVLAAGAPFLVSEAVRGEGAVLRDRDGRRFAVDAHPDGELAPRDVVARAIADRMAAQDGVPVVLDATALGAGFLAERFPTIDAAVRARGLDWARAPIPVTPAAHYLMGGVATDLDGRTSIRGLLAVGETARTGVHGANRLASNSLLEGAVFGARAGDAAARGALRAGVVVDGGLPRLPVRPSPAAPPFTRAALQELMWEHVGLVRDDAGLALAASILAAWSGRGDANPSTPRDAEDANLLLLATRVVAAARARRESIGAHHRSDSPVPLGAARLVSGAA